MIIYERTIETDMEWMEIREIVHDDNTLFEGIVILHFLSVHTHSYKVFVFFVFSQFFVTASIEFKERNTNVYVESCWFFQIMAV